jgi:hypothetical protein
MNAVFVDTGYLLALEIANDQHHQAAVQHWQQLVTEIPRLMTTSYVFDEGNYPGVRQRALHHGRKAAWPHGLGSFVAVVSFACFLNDLSGDVRAHVTCVRHPGDEKNGT